MKFSIKDFSSKWDQIRGKLRIWSHLLEKSLMENFIFLCSGGSSLTSLSQILQSSFNAIYRDQTTIENPKLETMHNVWDEKFDLPSFFKIWKFNNPCDVIKSKLD